MKLDDIFSQAREHYLKKWSEAQSAMALNGRRVVREVKSELGGETRLYRNAYCFDLIEKQRDVGGGESHKGVDVDPDARLQFPVFGFQMSGVYVRISHLHWDRMNLAWTGGLIPDEAFDAWFRQWYDSGDTRYVEGAEFQEHIHSAIKQDDALSVDLGSAPTKALWDILWLIEKSGATVLHLFDETAEPRDPPPPLGPQKPSSGTLPSDGAN